MAEAPAWFAELRAAFSAPVREATSTRWVSPALFRMPTRHEAVWGRSAPGFDVAGRKLPPAKSGAPRAAGRYLSKPEEAGP